MKTSVEEILDTGYDINKPFRSGIKPMELAKKQGNQKIVDLLLAMGADDIAINDDKKDSLEHLKIILDVAGATHVNNKFGQNERTLLIHAVISGNEDKLDLLLTHNADPSITDKNNKNALDYAVETKNKKVVQKLLNFYNANGIIDVNRKSGQDERTPLINSVINNNAEIFDLLLAYSADFRITDKNNKNSLDYAVELDNSKIAKTLLENYEVADIINRRSGYDGNTLIMYCAQNNNEELYDRLLERGADPTLFNKNAKNAFHFTLEVTANNPHRQSNAMKTLHNLKWSLLAAISSGSSNAFTIAMEQSAKDNFKNINNQNTEGMTAFMFAVSKCSEEIINELIKHGADINLQNNYGNTALIRLIFHTKKRPSLKNNLVFLLSRVGIDFNIKNNQGNNALAIAKEKADQQIITLLKVHGAQE